MAFRLTPRQLVGDVVEKIAPPCRILIFVDLVQIFKASGQLVTSIEKPKLGRFRALSKRLIAAKNRCLEARKSFAGSPLMKIECTARKQYVHLTYPFGYSAGRVGPSIQPRVSLKYCDHRRALRCP